MGIEQLVNADETQIRRGREREKECKTEKEERRRRKSNKRNATGEI